MNVVDGISRMIRLNMLALVMVGALAVTCIWLGEKLAVSQRQVRELQARLEQKQQECAGVQSDLQQARTTQHTLQAQVDAQLRTLSELRAEVRRLTAETARWQARAAERARAADEAGARLKQAEEEVAGLQERIAANQQMVTECRTSRYQSSTPYLPSAFPDQVNTRERSSSSTRRLPLLAFLTLAVAAVVLALLWGRRQRRRRPISRTERVLRPLRLRPSTAPRHRP